MQFFRKNRNNNLCKNCSIPAVLLCFSHARRRSGEAITVRETTAQHRGSTAHRARGALRAILRSMAPVSWAIVAGNLMTLRMPDTPFNEWRSAGISLMFQSTRSPRATIRRVQNTNPGPFPDLLPDEHATHSPLRQTLQGHHHR